MTAPPIGSAQSAVSVAVAPVLDLHLSGLVQPGRPIDYAPWNAWSLYWASSVGFFVFVLFLPPELYAIASGHPENTLSAQFWRIGDVIAGQNVTEWAGQHWAMAVPVTMLFSWLIVHFDLGWLR